MEAEVDLALALGLPFAVVPCCVFPSEFPDRRVDGSPVRFYPQLLAYLRAKHPRIRSATLPFNSAAGDARNVHPPRGQPVREPIVEVDTGHPVFLLQGRTVFPCSAQFLAIRGGAVRAAGGRAYSTTSDC